MTVTKRIFSAALALTFLLALIALPAPAKAEEATSVSMGTSAMSIQLGSSGSTATASLSASLKGLAHTSSRNILWTTNNPAVVHFGGTDVTKTTQVTGSASGSVDLTAAWPGVATITAQACNESGAATGVQTTCRVTVTQKMRISIASFDAGPLSIDTNASGTASVSVEPSVYNGYFRIDWSSSNEDAINVSGNGTSATYVGNKAVGTATIRATLVPTGSTAEFFSGDYAEFKVSSESTQPYLTISKNPSSTIEAHDFPGSVTVELHNDGGVSGQSVSWKNGDSSVIKETGKDGAINSGTASFDFRTNKNGSSKVTATVVTSTGKTLTASTTVKVNKPLPILTISGGSSMNASNRNLTLTAKLDDNDTNTYDGDERIRWESSKSKLVSIVSADSHLDDYVAQAVIRSHYNGTGIRITVSMRDNSDISAYHTVQVSGLSYLPQTGQNTAILYVIGGLCVLMFASAAILYARRKKQENA